MGGSGGGGYFERQTPENVKEALRREEQITENQTFDARVAEAIGDLLADYNNRDPEAVNREIEAVKKALEVEIEQGAIAPLFGGSVRKHTYVDGVSDVDCLFVLKSEELARLSPDEVLNYFEGRIREKFDDAKVERDQMAVTLDHNGIRLQMLPAIRGETGTLYIPSASGRDWSRIRPEPFLRKLSEVNAQNGNKVVPTIKIVKGINDTFPEPQRLTGYHVESLAIEVFRDYTGPQNTKSLVQHFFEAAKERVLSPIKDKTGQSVHVDDYAGPKNSPARKLMSQNLDRIARRIRNANATHSPEKWLRVLDPEAE